jgi:CTP synthase
MQNRDETEIKYIFVTGGVVSGIGKGICAASVGYILKSSGYTVGALKMDPYLNVDPGTMSPFEHGEVFVLEDGKETDLDLGNYERFLDINLDSNASNSSGSIYTEIFKNERDGNYLGKTVQMIPHVTDFIQEKFKFHRPQTQIKIIEIGGSTGDIEAEVFLESLRQFKVKNKHVLHIHLGYLPFLKVVGEYKSKPLQNSIKELLRLGLQPDIVVLRYEPNEGFQIQESLREKIALYCNTDIDSIVELPDFKSIYSVPKHLIQNTNIVNKLSELMGVQLEPKINKFFMSAGKEFNKTLNIALIGKYSGLWDSYLSVIESVKIAAVHNEVGVCVKILDSESPDLLDNMKEFDAFIVPGGFGKRGMEHKIKAIKYIRENKKPFLGICLGLQMAVTEYLRGVCNLPNAISREMLSENDIDSKFNICIDYMPEQMDIKLMGGTMRLGSYLCHVMDNTLASSLFKKDVIKERHRHRLEVQSQYVDTLEKNGMIISGKFHAGSNYLVEIIELSKKVHPYFIATQSHPEFLSRPDRPHPLFDGLIRACVDLT